MRDIVVTLAVFGSLPFILKRPWIGILVWTWLGFMNPHRLAWGFSTTLPFAMIVAVTTLVAMLLRTRRRRFRGRAKLMMIAVLLGLDADHDIVCVLSGRSPGSSSTRCRRSS